MNPVYTADDLDRKWRKRLELLEKFSRSLKAMREYGAVLRNRRLRRKEDNFKFAEALYAGMSIAFNGCAEKLEDELESVEGKEVGAGVFGRGEGYGETDEIQ